MKKTVESNWNQISDDEWEVIDRDSVIEKFSDWIYSQVDVDKKIKSGEKDGNLALDVYSGGLAIEPLRKSMNKLSYGEEGENLVICAKNYFN